MATNLDPPSLRPYRPVRFDDLVRVGRDHDGGYVLPECAVDGSSALLSLGVRDDWSFEEGVLDRNPGIRVVCVDDTTGMLRLTWKAGCKAIDMIGYLLTAQMDRFVRNARYLSRPLLFQRFFARHELLKRTMAATSGGRGRLTLVDALRRVEPTDPEGWTLVKCDIEGSEYSVLPGVGAALGRVSALVIEFHRLDRRWREFVSCMDVLMSDFHIAHLHGNNFDGLIAGTRVPITLEISLVNKAFAPEPWQPARGPYPVEGLDMPNSYKRPDLRISFD